MEVTLSIFLLLLMHVKCSIKSFAQEGTYKKLNNAPTSPDNLILLTIH